MPNSLAQWIALPVSILICFAVAGVGSLFTNPEIGGWYATLQKPSWTPPNWLFGPVWSLLYLSMAVAGWLVWREGGAASVAVPLALFGVQLALNLLWSILFFGQHRTGLAFIEIMVLWAAILATIFAFWRVSAVAGALLVPYLLWVSFAATLNYAVWRLNA